MKWTRILRKVFQLGLGVALCGGITLSQTGTTSLHGVVTDKTGAAITGAQIKLANPAQGLERATTTGAGGEYEFLGLAPGTYSLLVEMANFRKYEQRNIQLLVNNPTTVNVTLEIGSAAQTVEVSAQAVTLNTTDASLGIAFSENQVKQLPMEGRNVPDLLTLQPGVAYTGNRADVPTSDTRSGAVNGARSDQSNVTLDGIGVNDEGGHAFTSVLPVTLDSVQEFRVTTSNSNADQGGTSGAQVALVTKSGTNEFHGSAYEYHRNTYTSANDYFVKQSELENCTLANPNDCNKAPKLIRNIFGASLGGPIMKDRLYFFTNYEGTRRSEQVSQTVTVPSASLRDGVIFYQCDSSSPTIATDCPGGTVTGMSGTKYTIPAPNGNIAYNALSPQQIAQIDPLHVGPSAAVMSYLNTWPTPNNTNVGDGFNYQGFNFAAPISDTRNDYIAKMDYNISRDGKHHVSVSGALRNETNAGAPFLPGEPPSQSIVNYNKGIIVNYSGVLKPSLINNFRYGYIRESLGTIGNSDQQWILFRGLNDQTGAITRSNRFQRPIHVFADDVSWIRGRHTWQFGGLLSFIRNPRSSTLSSFSDGVANAGWFNTTGFAGKTGSPLNPSNNINPATNTPYPGVDGSFANSYDFPLTALMGMVSQVDAQYNFARSGNALPQGAALTRHFAIDDYETYLQDVWKVKPSLTLTLGLRYSLFSPLWETKGLEVCPTFNLGQWFNNRVAEGANGIASNQDQPVAFNWCGPSNSKSGYWNWDYKNLGPRVAFAWAPKFTSGLFGDLFGEGKTSIRGGFGIVYDRFGQGIADNFDRNGSFGLSTTLTNQAALQTVASAPRLTDIHTIPATDNNGTTVFLPSPGANFPVPFPSGLFSATTGLDSSLKTPYSFTLDLSVARELRGGFAVELAYVGRLSHRLLTSEDLAMPLDLKDKKSGLDYFTAVQALAKLYRSTAAGGKGVTDANFADSMVSPAVAQYWADVLQRPTNGGSYLLGGLTGGCGQGGPASTTDPLFAAFDLFCGGNFNETTPLQFLDQSGIPDATGDANCGQAGHPPCQYFGIGGPFTFFTPQYAALYSWRSIGSANYNALQVTLRHRMSHGVQFDFNYTYSKSIDLSSDAERAGTFGGIGGNQVINSWSPNLFRSVSDFDATHQFNSNWVADLPFGRGRAIGGQINKGLDAVIGGWQLSGLFRLTSGFPISVFNGFNFPTNWDLSGNAVPVVPPNQIQTGAFKDTGGTSGTVNIFGVGGTAAAAFFREPLPGEAGSRNFLRGNGFFGADLGLSKRWAMPWAEKQSLQLRWEVFNVTNSVRFDAQSTNNAIDSFGSQFGNYTRLLTNPRVMQFALRYEF
ncbi:MAG TPA: carboxypeptidase-like regulatory domain-containing protein [Candidatus Dormibacteraeota bacterium]|jgi:hypothetical protein|nr:carboxypeptidase-like regulatory domain-containing protein [Candidatus Dormibacteraeota bacterium]